MVEAVQATRGGRALAMVTDINPIVTLVAVPNGVVTLDGRTRNREQQGTRLRVRGWNATSMAIRDMEGVHRRCRMGYTAATVLWATWDVREFL